MTLTRERPQVREEQRLEARQVLPGTQMPTSIVYWIVAILVLAAVVVALWLVPGAEETAELGEPITVQEFALLEDQVVRDPGVTIPGITRAEFAAAEDALTETLLPEPPALVVPEVVEYPSPYWCREEFASAATPCMR